MAARRNRAWGREAPALVCVVTRPKDWRLLREQHWYRIPVRTAPPELATARYLAFYQTRAFGSEKWSVNWYALVLGMQQRTRRELLPDEPDHPRAEDEYWQVQVGELVPLPAPIPSRRLRRIVFIPTTMERLLVAAEINDLFRSSPIEDRLYDALRRAGIESERQYYVREQGEGFMLDMAIMTKGRKLAIECDGEAYHSGREKAARDRRRDNALNAGGWHVLRFSGGEIWHNPMKMCPTGALRPHCWSAAN